MGLKHALALLLVSGVGLSAPEDKPAEFLIDISSTTENPLGILIKSKKGLWQLTRERVRRGYGLGFFSILHNRSNNCEAQMFVEVEPLQGSLDKAVKEATDGLADTLMAASTQLMGEVKSGKRKLYKVGGTKVFGVKLRYAVQVQDSYPLTTDPVTALMFEHDGALITVTVENYSRTTDYFTPLLKSMKLVKLSSVKTPRTLKVVDATRNTYRYITAQLPKQMTPNQASGPGNAAACYVRYGKKDRQPLVRIMLAKSDATRRIPFSKWVERRRSNYVDLYDEVSNPKKVRIGDRDWYLVTFLDRTEEGDGTPPHVTKALVKILDQAWIWTLETWAEKPAQVQKDRAEFMDMLASMNSWYAKPQ